MLPLSFAELKYHISSISSKMLGVHVRLIVNCMGEHVGSGFVEFGALMALERKNDHKNRTFFLDMVKTAPYPLRPKEALVRRLSSTIWKRLFGDFSKPEEM